MKVTVLCLFACASVVTVADALEVFAPLQSAALPESVSKSAISSPWLILGNSNSEQKPTAVRNSMSYMEVDTPVGKIKGRLSHTNRNNVPYAAFLGIPYAKPPVGDFRFQAPVEPDPWTGTWDATYERSSCMQFGGRNTESEDCLYVNVYTPNLEKGPLLPVMVFIHGGAFITGSSNSSIYAPDFIVDKNVLLVTFNYRLGVLGFLSFQTMSVPGNMGLKDQNLALKWIKKNIGSFGGDPNQITIFGESAGAASVHYHMLSPMSRGLFHRAIMESGSVTANWAFLLPEEVVHLGQRLALKMGCRQIRDDQIIECLKQVPARDLTDNQQTALSFQDILSMRPIAFGPTTEPPVEGAFMTESPRKMLLRKQQYKVPVIIGANSREGLITMPMMNMLDPLGLSIAYIMRDLTVFFPADLRNKLGLKALMQVHSAIKKRYFPPFNFQRKQQLVNLISDAEFIVPIVESAILMANASQSVYNYHFSYSGGYAFFKKKLNLEDQWGVCHGDELGYLFYDNELHQRSAGRSPTYREDETMVDIVTTLWTDFARTGSPTPNKGTELSPDWKPFQDPHYYTLDVGERVTLKSAYYNDTMNFWFNLILKANNM